MAEELPESFCSALVSHAPKFLLDHVGKLGRNLSPILTSCPSLRGGKEETATNQRRFSTGQGFGGEGREIT